MSGSNNDSPVHPVCLCAQDAYLYKVFVQSSQNTFGDLCAVVPVNLREMGTLFYKDIHREVPFCG